MLQCMSDSPGLNPEFFASADLRAALASRDVTTVYRLLTKAGIAQRTIAAATGQSQSEVSEILRKGRQVMAYDVLVRICTGLGIPRGMMGPAYDEDIESEPVGEVDEDVKRRALLAVGGVSLLGAPVLGEVLHIPVRPDVPTPLPARLGASDVSAIKSLTAELRTLARTHGGCAETVTGVAQRSLALMSIPASELIWAGLGSVESALKKAREHRMSSVFDDADLDYGTSEVYRQLGKLDIAEQFAASSVRRWKAEGTSRRDSVRPDIALATIHLTAGEPDGAALAHRAIMSVAELRSVRARKSLGRLVDALETRSRSDNRELAHQARQVASVRA